LAGLVAASTGGRESGFPRQAEFADACLNGDRSYEELWVPHSSNVEKPRSTTPCHAWNGAAHRLLPADAVQTISERRWCLRLIVTASGRELRGLDNEP
jgi:hypothetical protein